MIIEGNRSYYDIQLANELCGQKKKESEQAPKGSLRNPSESSLNYSTESLIKKSPMTPIVTSRQSRESGENFPYSSD